MLELVREIEAQDDHLTKVKIMCNREEDLIRPETEEDPTRRGQRKYKRALAAIKTTLGELKPGLWMTLKYLTFIKQNYNNKD